MNEQKEQPKGDYPKREKVTREEASRRMKAFPKRREKFIAAIRAGMNRKQS